MEINIRENYLMRARFGDLLLKISSALIEIGLRLKETGSEEVSTLNKTIRNRKGMLRAMAFVRKKGQISTYEEAARERECFNGMSNQKLGCHSIMDAETGRIDGIMNPYL